MEVIYNVCANAATPSACGKGVDPAAAFLLRDSDGDGAHERCARAAPAGRAPLRARGTCVVDAISCVLRRRQCS